MKETKNIKKCVANGIRGVEKKKNKRGRKLKEKLLNEIKKIIRTLRKG